ncbi:MULTISPECIES: DUF72 domain-containing protein [Galbibacter]|uniref:DUF72 domain-containing protein n=1 Tax=Galbibacter pacificus TaxID=2996052 RepID=A0ABT6FQM3_9FLAO|nr:DUF72 domain-containing protein [Galbibacter pacificus]MDG3581953.1 DUF72 domain-containing protein [Galbibacter pacificus]MDG3585573.1 DUF72 domain-containing protein [Galbibacter pacificus]
MKFGKVNNPENIDFKLPKDHPETEVILKKKKTKTAKLKVHVGCAKWNKQDLKGFYPRGTKDELSYYSSQFNSIEMNSTFYRNFPIDQFDKWYEKVPADFKFFPKVNQMVSHMKRLIEPEKFLPEYLDGVSHFKDKLGTIFLQMHNNFGPKNFDRVIHFIEQWPKEFGLAVEFRHTDWFNDEKVAQELYHLLEENNVTNVLVDTAGRRDLLHMRLTTNEAFIRYVGANHATDYERLDDWVNRLKIWHDEGLSNINFFVHQNLEKESPLLSAYFIKKLNKELGTDLKIPKTKDGENPKLF